MLREVTEDDNYASGMIAKTNWKMPDEDKKRILESVKAAQAQKVQRPQSATKRKDEAPGAPKSKPDEAQANPLKLKNQDSSTPAIEKSP